MSKLVELVRRTECLQDQVAHFGRELKALREELLQLEGQKNGGRRDCLEMAMTLVQDLGKDFCSEQPHDLAERGNDWFVER